jgi:hypothetical protein
MACRGTDLLYSVDKSVRSVALRRLKTFGVRQPRSLQGLHSHGWMNEWCLKLVCVSSVLSSNLTVIALTVVSIAFRSPAGPHQAEHLVRRALVVTRISERLHRVAVFLAASTKVWEDKFRHLSPFSPKVQMSFHMAHLCHWSCSQGRRTFTYSLTAAVYWLRTTLFLFYPLRHLQLSSQLIL